MVFYAEHQGEATYESTAKHFAIGRATVDRWIRLKRETGDVAFRPRKVVVRSPVRMDWLERHVEADPDATLKARAKEHQAIHGGREPSISAIWQALRRLGFTHKKTVVAKERASERIVALRHEFLRGQVALDPKHLVFLDESGFRLGASPRYGWSERGEDCPGSEICGSWTTMTMMGAIGLEGFRGFATFDCPTSGESFLAFIEHQVCPALRPGDLVVMDNLAAHKVQGVQAAIERAGASVCFLPPYSPEFNPIEKLWAKLKDIVRRTTTDTRDLFDAAVATAMDAITVSDLAGWFSHCGYGIDSI